MRSIFLPLAKFFAPQPMLSLPTKRHVMCCSCCHLDHSGNWLCVASANFSLNWIVWNVMGTCGKIQSTCSKDMEHLPNRQLGKWSSWQMEKKEQSWHINANLLAGVTLLVLALTCGCRTADPSGDWWWSPFAQGRPGQVQALSKRRQNRTWILAIYWTSLFSASQISNTGTATSSTIECCGATSNLTNKRGIRGRANWLPHLLARCIRLRV